MSTEKPRITITLEPEQYEVIKRTGELQGRSMSSVVVDIVASFTPGLGRVVAAMERVHKAGEQLEASVARAMDDADATILPHVQSVIDQYEQFDDRLQSLLGQLDEGTRGGAASEREAPGAGPRRGDPQPVITGVREGQRRGPARKVGRPVAVKRRA